MSKIKSGSPQKAWSLSIKDNTYNTALTNLFIQYVYMEYIQYGIYSYSIRVCISIKMLKKNQKHFDKCWKNLAHLLETQE